VSRGQRLSPHRVCSHGRRRVHAVPADGRTNGGHSPPAIKEIDVDVIIPIAILAAVLGLAFTPALQGLREPRTDQAGDAPRTDQAGDEPLVTLSVLPGRRAVVTVNADPERSPGAAHLVDQAVRDAFTLVGVDSVEVRRADGELLEGRLRPTPE
jgi:hypothetical protein